MAEAPSIFVAADDPELISETIQYPGKAGSVEAYLSRPKESGKRGAVIVIHENKGLNDHIRDIARRLAKEGLVAFAPDLLSRAGGTRQFKSPDEATQAIGKLSRDGVVEDLQSAVAHLPIQPFVNGRIGVVGFCWGGGQSLNFTTQCKELSAAVVYYGRNPDPLDRVQNINCPVLGNYGQDDPNIVAGVEPLREALKRYGKTGDLKVYPGAKHAFNNNTNPERYHAEAAKDAWIRTSGFFTQNLAG